MAVGGAFNFDRKKALAELEESGYTVIPGVLQAAECDTYIKQYREWLKQFGEKDKPFGYESLIQNYRIGHFEATWDVRLKSKPVFTSIWGTDKLLSSVDAVAIGEPPEIGGATGMFATPGRNWLHLDQGARRKGLHAYQGGVYLEETTDMDHCFRVLENSHKYHSEFFRTFPHAVKATEQLDGEFYKLEPDEQMWYKEKGCEPKKVPCPKGGIVLWDSRTVHDNCRPEYERPNKHRWRFVVFVCMVPALWTTPQDLAKKRGAYNKLRLTTHWPAEGVALFAEKMPRLSGLRQVKTLEKLPDNAMTTEARLLMGVDEYDFEDGESNGPDTLPTYGPDVLPALFE